MEKIFVGEVSGAKAARPGLQQAMNSLREGDVLVVCKKLIFHFFGALAEFERNLIRDRTNVGLAAARIRGRAGGRPKKLDEQQRQFVTRFYREGTPRPDILKRVKISKSTLFSYMQNET